MKVVEIFNSIQGEGAYIGSPCTFVRLAGCNLRCSYCDTKYAMAGGYEIGAGDLQKRIRTYRHIDTKLHHIVFTGGEPMLQQDELAGLRWWDTEHIALETNGTIALEGRPWFDFASISPKLSSAGTGDPDLDGLRTWFDYRIGPYVVRTLKFVITRRFEVFEAADLVRELHLEDLPIFFQPDGRRGDYAQALGELYVWLKHSAINDLNWRMLPQLHRIIWGPDARGV